MNRRGFLTGAGALLMAPALVRASSLEYVPRRPVPIIWGDGIHCDSDGLKALFTGRPVRFATGFKRGAIERYNYDGGSVFDMGGRTFSLGKKLVIPRGKVTYVQNGGFESLRKLYEYPMLHMDFGAQ